MARIPEGEIERLKSEVAVERLVEASGVELKRAGKDLLGRCPFHEDAEASLVVTSAKNLWHCFGCQIGGGPIDWVMKTQGVSFRHAIELLRNDSPLAASVVKVGTVRKLPAPVAYDADDERLLAQVVGYYHETLEELARGAGLPESPRPGPSGADRSLQAGIRQPHPGAAASGGQPRGRGRDPRPSAEAGHAPRERPRALQRLARGSRVRRGGAGRGDLRAQGDAQPARGHALAPVPAGAAPRGVESGGAPGFEGDHRLRGPDRCDDLLVRGVRNVTSSYGVEGFTDDILAAFKAHGTERVLIAYDRDEAGEQGGGQARRAA